MPPRPSQQQAASALASVADQLRDVAAAGDDRWLRSHDLAVSLLDLGLDAAGPAEQKLRGGTGTISNPSCLEVTGHTTAYRMCRADNFTIDGAITSETDGSGVTHLIYWALTLEQATAGASVTMALDGEVWLSPTAMRGVLTVKLDSRVNGAPTQVTTRVSYNDVTISPCGISSGSIRVDYDIVVSTVGGIGLPPIHSGGSVLLEWTACNDLTARNS